MQGQRVKALADFVGAEAGELSFKEGEIFVLLEKDTSGWAKGLLREKKGWFPWDYVELLPEEKIVAAAAPVVAATTQPPKKEVAAAAVVQPVAKVEPLSPKKEVAASSSAPVPAAKEKTAPPPVKQVAVEVPVVQPPKSARGEAPKTDRPDNIKGSLLIMTSPRESNTRKVSVTVLQKDTPPASAEQDSVLNIFIGDSKKQDLISNILQANPQAPTKFHQTALELYESYMEETGRALKLIYQREKQGISAPTSSADPYNPSNQRKLLTVFRNFIVSVGSRERLGFGLSEAVEIILYLVRSLKLPTTTAAKDDAKKWLPSAKELESQPVDTVLEFICGSTLELLRTRETDIATTMTITQRTELSNFLFQCIFYVNPPAARKAAAESLGLLSRSNLEAVITLFTKELSVSKDLKEYCSYQRAVRLACQFKLDKTLVQYITFVLPYVEKPKASLLFMSISQTIIDVMTETRASVAIPAIADDELRTALVNVLYRFYEVVGKNWFKKPKTKLYAFKIQLFLYALFDIQKMDLCKKGLVGLLLEMLRDAKHRREAIEEYGSFLRSLPSEFARGTSGKVWKATVGELLGALFVKKAKEVEAKELTAVLTEILRLDLTLLQSEVLTSVIRGTEYPTEARGLVLRCIGGAVVQSADKSAAEPLQATVTPVMLQSLNQSAFFEPLCACFPVLVIPEKRRQVAIMLLPSALSSNPELWTHSLQALQRFMLDEGNNLGALLGEIFTYLGNLQSVSSEDVLSHVRAVCLILSTFLNSSRSAGLTVENWANIQTQLEVLAFAWALNVDLEIRQEACQLFDLIGRISALNGSLTFTLSSFIGKDVLDKSPHRKTKAEWQLYLCDVILKQDPRFYSAHLANVWLVLSKPISLEHFSFFFGRTLHVVLQSANIGLANDVISQFLAWSASEHKDVRSLACESLQHMDGQLCLEALVRISAIDKGKAKKPEKTLRSTKIDPSHHLAIIQLQFHALLAAKAPSELYNSSNPLRGFIRERVGYWSAAGSAEALALHLEARTALADLIGKFLELESKLGAPNAPETDAFCKEAAHLMGIIAEFAFATGVVAESADEKSAHRALRKGVARAILSYFRFAPISSSTLHATWAPFAFHCVAEWPKTASIIEEAFSHVVARFPLQIESIARFAEHNDLWFCGLARSFERHSDTWLALVGPEPLIFVTMLYLCSAHSQSREAATVVANVLSRHNVSPGYRCLYSANLHHLHVEFALDYSRAIAASKPNITAAILGHFASLMPSLDSHKKALVLQLLAPWIKNFAVLSKEHLDASLEYLFSISVHSDCVLHAEQIQTVWKSVHIGGDKAVPNMGEVVVDFLVSRYASHSEHCILALSSLIRTERGESVVALLVKKLRHYPVIPPPDIANMLMATNSDAASENETFQGLNNSVFQMVVYVSHEKCAFLWSHLPKLLHVSFLAYSFDAGQAQVLVSNILESISPGIKTDVGAIMKKVSAGDRSAETVEALCALVDVCAATGGNNHVRQEWSFICLKWAAWSLHQSVGSKCLFLFQTLHHGPIGGELCSKISCLFFTYEFRGLFGLLDELLAVLDALITTCGFESDASKEMFVTTLSPLLSSARHKQVAHVLALLRKVSPKPFAQQLVNVLLHGSDLNGFKAAMTRPLLADGTRELGLWMLRQFVQSSIKDDLAASSFATHLLLVVSAILSLGTDGGRDACHAYFTDAQTPAALRGAVGDLFSRTGFHLKPTTRTKWIQDWCTVLLSLSPKSAALVAAEVLDVLIVMTRLCDSIRAPCFELLAGLMDATPAALTGLEYKHLAEMSTLHCFSSQDDVRLCAERMLLDLVGHFQPNVLPAQNVAFIRIMPSTSVLDADRIEALFAGDSAADFFKALKTSIECLYISAFKGKKNDHVFLIIAERLKECKIPGITDNTRVTNAPSRHVRSESQANGIKDPGAAVDAKAVEEHHKGGRMFGKQKTLGNFARLGKHAEGPVAASNATAANAGPDVVMIAAPDGPRK